MPADYTTVGPISAQVTEAARRARAREKLDFCKAYALQQGQEHSSPEGVAIGALHVWDRLMEDPEIKELIG